jgi:2',3'-cyclic-nucleotide 2'-phosphodiesterase (5'-nucleotidase family)
MRKYFMFLFLAVCIAAISFAQTTITFMHFNDLHAHLTPHKDMIRVGDTCSNDPAATTKIGERGGLARLKTLINQIRASNPNSILMNIGDTYHGGVEAAYTQGNAIVDPVNALGIDVGVPGNWDFGYGPGVWRKRYTPAGPFPPALNVFLPSFPIQSVTYTNLAANLTYKKLGPLDPSPDNGQVLPATTIITKNGIKIGFIGITSDIVPKMYTPLTTGFNFVEGEANYKNIIETNATVLRNAGCKLVVVMSELGIHKDHRLAQIITQNSVDIFFSAHTHEATFKPLTSTSGAIVVEAGNDGYLGRMDVTFDAAGNVTGKQWQLLSITPAIAEDPAMAALVNTARAPFLTSNPNLTDPMGTSSQTLTQPITTVVGHTNGLLTRKNALESSFNNAFTNIARNKAGTQLAISPGFRFDSPIAASGYLYEDNTIADGSITLEDVYRFFPVFYTMATAKVRGDTLKTIVENLLTQVFSQNAFSQEGGWVDGFAGLDATINLSNADGSKVISMKRAGTSTIINPSDTFSVIGCVRPNENADVLCSHTGFFDKQDFINPLTGQAYTALQILTEYLSTNTVPITSMNHFTDQSTIKQWPVNPFVQPINNYSCTQLIITGISNLAFSSGFIKTFPNPVKNNLYLQIMDENNSINEVYIYNSMGQKVLHYVGRWQLLPLNLSHLPNSVYILKVIAAKKIFTQKFMKQ